MTVGLNRPPRVGMNGGRGHQFAIDDGHAAESYRRSDRVVIHEGLAHTANDAALLCRHSNGLGLATGNAEAIAMKIYGTGVVPWPMWR